ncbi:hypothetical protein JYU14_04070 [Simkania negevensis]|uniref:Uncharacterized protein n=1 Tax=Simkania negevensis TaxID=83561 RepID=A0ABS3AR76_9BACT|nr:hypothetical protein [Simkania negevensis]
MATNKARKYLAVGFTIFNVLLFFPLLILAYIAPMGIGSSSYGRTAIFFIVVTLLSPLSVPLGVYKGWKYRNNSSIKPFLFYQLLPLTSLGLVIIFCIVVSYWLW